jgi:hypothetical protein
MGKIIVPKLKVGAVAVEDIYSPNAKDEAGDYAFEIISTDEVH